MASANAGPITGGEFLRVVQGGFEVWLTRAEVVTLLAMPELPSPPIYGVLTAIDGTETIRAVQWGSTIRLHPSDLAGYLAGFGIPDIRPDRYRPTQLSGAERILGAQGGDRMAFTISQFLAVKSGGIPTNALLSRIDNQPLTSRIDGSVILARAA